MVNVILMENCAIEVRDVPLDRHSMLEIFGPAMTFCYYIELDEHVVVTGMLDPARGFVVYVKLSDNEPVSLTHEELIGVLEAHPEHIPLDE